MPDVDRCPHCEREITQEDIKDRALYKTFEKTEACRAIFRTSRRFWLTAVVLGLMSLFVAPFFKVNVAGREIDLLMFSGMLIGVVLLGIDFLRADYKRKKLFGEFKKSQAAQ
jgi:hypothetical protein